MALAAVWYSAAAEQSSADNGAALVGAAGVETAGGGAVALWLAQPARTTQPSTTATNRAGVASATGPLSDPGSTGHDTLHQLW